MTVYEFKTSIVQTIQRRAVMKGIELDKVLRVDDFKLIGDGRKLEETDPLKVNEVFIQLFIRGGGKSVLKTKDKKLQLVERLKKDIMEASQKINNDNIKSLASVKAVEKKISDMMTAQDTEKALKELALNCDSKEKLDECIALLDRSDKSTQVCNTVEGRLKRVSKIIFGRDGSQILEMKEQIDHITDAMNSSLQFLYMKTSASSDRFDIGDFRTMLISARSYLEGKDAML